jgi:hypothetical protein
MFIARPIRALNKGSGGFFAIILKKIHPTP